MIKIKRMNSSISTPLRAKEGDVGLDLKAVSVEKTGNWIFPLYTYRTGLQMELPKGYFGMLVPRSSLSKKLMWMANHVGIIDNGYRGELMFKFRSILGINPYKVGERVGQLVVLKYEEMDVFNVNELNETDRGEGGFGSTGK